MLAVAAAAWGPPGAGRVRVGVRTWLRGHSGMARVTALMAGGVVLGRL